MRVMIAMAGAVLAARLNRNYNLVQTRWMEDNMNADDYNNSFTLSIPRYKEQVSNVTEKLETSLFLSTRRNNSWQSRILDEYRII